MIKPVMAPIPELAPAADREQEDAAGTEQLRDEAGSEPLSHGERSRASSSLPSRRSCMSEQAGTEVPHSGSGAGTGGPLDESRPLADLISTAGGCGCLGSSIDSGSHPKKWETGS